MVVNHAASVLMAEELDLGADGRLELGEEGLNFTGAELTVREFMEEQQQKRNGLIHGDSDHIAVEGISAHGMLLMKRKSVARSSSCWSMRNTAIWRPVLQSMSRENWWQKICGTASMRIFRRMQKISLKMEYAEKKNVVSEQLKKSVPVADNSAQDYSDVPVYYEPFSYAKK